MNLFSLIEDNRCRKLLENKVWARQGNKLVRKTRCTSGPKAGRIVSSPDLCGKPLEVKKSIRMKITRKQKQKIMARRSKKTKRVNYASKLLQILNKPR